MITALISLLLGQPLPTLTQNQLEVLNPKTLCGYIGGDDEHDTWANTTLDHCRVLQQEAIEVWWDDMVVEMQDRGEL